VTASRARLAVGLADGESRVALASATAPQRWVLSRGARCALATHQVIGDGVFGGDTLLCRIDAGPGAVVTVRSVAATPLRAGAPSAMVTRIRAVRGATVVYLPGALIPQAGSDHTSSLRVTADADAKVLAASVVVPGRSAMGERGAFRRLRLRTEVRAGGRLVLREDAAFDPQLAPVDSLAMFAGQGAAVTCLAVGAWAAARPEWWEWTSAIPGVVGGAGRLRGDGGATFRALCGSLGEAQWLVREIEERAAPARGI
jgi:urease accessory protein UreH